MPRQQGLYVQRDFKLGLITEATGLAYPDDAVIFTDNCEFDLLGRVSRRDGFDFEAGYSTQAINKQLSAINTFVWKNVNGDGLVSFVVTQIGSTLYFYDANNAVSLSAGYKSSTIDLTGFSPSGAPTPRINDCQFADGFGVLFVTHPNLEPFYITYNSSADTFGGTQISVMIRDFKGDITDPLAIDARPAIAFGSITPAHHYNLANQGWSDTNITAWDTGRSDLPSNCDVWWDYLNTSDAFDVTQVPNDTSGNTAAPKGHFLLNYFNQNRSSVSGISSVTSDSTGVNRPTTGTFFAGRVWYTGINVSGYNEQILFSQIAESTADFGKCYQNNDPTASDFFDLEVTDGGVLSVPGAGTIYRLFPMRNALIVFGARGIWSITGSTGIGFTANDFTIQKISSIRSVSPFSYVDINGNPMFWNADGIFTVVAQQNQDGLTQITVNPITWTTIQTFYDEIPNLNKPFVRGAFNPTTQIAQWLYRSAIALTIEDNYKYDSVLVFNARSNAIYTWSLPPTTATDVYLHSIAVVDSIGAQTIEYQVIDGSSDTVQDASSDNVVAYAQSQTSVDPLFKYLCSYPAIGANSNITFASQVDTSYRDWQTRSPFYYDSSFITGYKLGGQGAMRFQPGYVFWYNEGNGEYYVTGVWDFATTGATGKYTTSQHLLYSDSSRSNLHKKIKIRGNGRTLQFLIESEKGQPFNIVGYAALESVSQVP